MAKSGIFFEFEQGPVKHALWTLKLKKILTSPCGSISQNGTSNVSLESASSTIHRQSGERSWEGGLHGA